MKIKLKDGGPELVRIAGPGFSREYRRADGPWDLRAEAAELAGAVRPGERPERYEQRLNELVNRLWAPLRDTGHFEELAAPAPARAPKPSQPKQDQG